MDDLVRPYGAERPASDPRSDSPGEARADPLERRSAASTDRRRDDRLHRLAGAFAGALTTREVVAVIASHLTAALGGASAVVVRRAPAGASLEILGPGDVPARVADDRRAIPLSSAAPLARVARTGEPVFIESREQWKRDYPDLLPLIERSGHHAHLVVPLLAEGRPGGALGVLFTEPRRFGADDRALAMTAGRQCSVALERARLLESERVARASAEALAARLADQSRALDRARKRADAARAEAEEANAARTAFLATMSHELRTPLNAIAGYTDLLAMGLHGPVTPPQEEALARIQHSSQHLLGLINDILNFARLETGSVEFDLSVSPLGTAFNFVIDVIGQQVAAKGLGMTYSPCDPDLVVHADVDKVRQILINLFSNAVKFTARGGLITSWCEVDAVRRIVCVHIRDTGVGIPTAQVGRIFEPFVQLGRRHSRPTEGTGLGLAISRDLARGMGGDLTVVSEVGVGSTFSLELRLGDHAPESGSLPPPVGLVTPPGSASPRNPPGTPIRRTGRGTPRIPPPPAGSPG